MARALIDQGSEISLISERLTQLLLPRINSSISLVGVGAQRSYKPRGIVLFKIQPHFDSDCEFPISAHVLLKLTGLIPSIPVKKGIWAFKRTAVRQSNSQLQVTLILS